MPIKIDTTSGVAKVGLLFDNTLQVNNLGQLGVKSQIATPSGTNFTFDAPLYFDSVNSNVSLLYDTEDLKVDDGKLKLVPDLWKLKGGLKLYGSVADALGDIGELMDFSDIDVTPDTPVHLKILKLNTTLARFCKLHKKITNCEFEVVNPRLDRAIYFYNGYIDTEERVRISMSVEVERPLGDLLDQYFEITLDGGFLSHNLDPIEDVM
ncbi:hypothetical protein HK104_007525 [Borealophlyctis nickersoniae]|nr:hypothetical protein HK104_007525 [Borealophlyctis nickersoniae]